MCEADREECRDLVSLPRERAGMEETWMEHDGRYFTAASERCCRGTVSRNVDSIEGRERRVVKG